MKTKSFSRIKIASLLLASMLFASLTQAAVKNGEMAPDFELPNASGEMVSLADHKGKYVVLEWTNHQCPFVVKHYENGDMQALQKKFTDEGVAWFGIVSSGKGKQGYCTPEQAKKVDEMQKAAMTARLLDPAGTVGKLYGAKTTPHMFVIDPEGKVVYQGAIDSIRSPYSEDVKKADNFVSLALTAALAGKPIEQAKTRPYGCGVKYKR